MLELRNSHRSSGPANRICHDDASSYFQSVIDSLALDHQPLKRSLAIVGRSVCRDRGLPESVISDVRGDIPALHAAHPIFGHKPFEQNSSTFKRQGSEATEFRLALGEGLEFSIDESHRPRPTVGDCTMLSGVLRRFLLDDARQDLVALLDLLRWSKMHEQFGRSRGDDLHEPFSVVGEPFAIVPETSFHFVSALRVRGLTGVMEVVTIQEKRAEPRERGEQDGVRQPEKKHQKIVRQRTPKDAAEQEISEGWRRVRVVILTCCRRFPKFRPRKPDETKLRKERHG